MSETTMVRASLYGRLVDELTREVVSSRTFEAFLSASGQRALQKDDGYFVFTDLEPSPSDYGVSLSARSYQTRTLTATVSSTSAVELSYA